MARKATHAPLNVFINSRLVGTLRREPSGAIDFRYDPSWLDWPTAMPVSLSLPLREDSYAGAPVIAVFDNLLPDNDAIRRQLAARLHAAGTDAFSLLGAIGRDCVGALQFLPIEQAPGPAGATDATLLSDRQIGALLANLTRAPLGLAEDSAFRISLAGAQEKTALMHRDGRWWMPSGTAATTHILKPAIGVLPDGTDFSDSVENEFLCMKLTGAFGLSVADVEMVQFAGHRALVVQRFDRLWTRDGRLLRLPQEDLCQALSTPPAIKYEADGGPGIIRIARLLSGSDDPTADQSVLMRASIVFWLLGATDGHAKNFSIFLRPGGRFGLTPLYDILSAQPAVDAGQLRHNRFRMSMAVGTGRHYAIDTVAPRHFVQTALDAGIGANNVERVFLDLIDRVEPALDRVLAELPEGFPQQLAASVRDAARRRLAQLRTFSTSGLAL